MNWKDPDSSELDPPYRTLNVTRKASWGIFEIAYDDPYQRRRSLFNYKAKDFKMPLLSISSMLRLLFDLNRVAFLPFTFLVFGSTWISVAPALSTYLSFSVIQGCIGVRDVNIELDQCKIFVLAFAWLGCLVTSSLVERGLSENKAVLGAHLKAHFLPRVAKACLDLDIRYAKDPTLYPDTWGFGNGAPALNFIEELSSRVRETTAVALEIIVVVHIASTMPSLDSLLLKGFCIIFLSVVFFVPSNGVGGAGYTFWTSNKFYHRLNGLYWMIFDAKYRETICKDGLANRLAKGTAKNDTLTLALHIPLAWYWITARTVVIEHPMALYALTLPWTASPTSLVTMAVFYQATTIIEKSISRLEQFQDPYLVLMRHIRIFYQRLDGSDKPDTGAVMYPTQRSSRMGMRISFRNVSRTYDGSNGVTKLLALDDVNINIDPGQLVVIVGSNGSGKTSFLKMLVGLDNPTHGEVVIDDRPVEEYDIHSLRRSVAFLTQSEEIYPVSLRENILMGAPDLVGKSRRDTGALVDEAARLGGAYKLIQRFSYDKILHPPPGVVGQSMKGFGNGEIGTGAQEELQRNYPVDKSPIILSGGERQRLIASRTFMRLKNGSDIELLVVDEPTSAIDPIVERDILDRFCDMRNGKTMICVTHRFGNMVKRADLVLCMKDGKIVQRGTHKELMVDEVSEYRKLYAAQVD